MKSLLRTLASLRPYWITVLGAFVSLLLVTAANLISPQVLAIVIDQGVSARNLAVVGYASLALVGVATVRGVFSFTQGYLIERASQGAAYDIRNNLFGHITHLSFSYHDKAQTGQLMTRVTNDVEQVRTFIGNGFLQVLNAVVMLFGSITILLVMNWQLTLVALAMVPVVMFVFIAFFRIVGPHFRLIQQKLGNLNTVLQENLAGVRVVKAFAREPYEWTRYRAANDDLLIENLFTVRGFAVAFPLIFFVANLGTLGIIWLGGRQVITDTLTIGELVAFNTYLTFLLMPIFILGGTLSSISSADASARRIFEVTDAPIEITDNPGAKMLPAVQGRVVFDNVSFRYSGSDQASLSGISFVAEPGQNIAIMGRTGTGKSTLINLIPRFYDVTSGSVTIDGNDVRAVTLTSLRTQIGIVLQETTLFSGTIRENITYGCPPADDAAVETAARIAQAHDFITELPDGYATVVGERGIGLSGGQRQRLAIARALLLDPPLLILDDSTSAVDAETEYKIQRALEYLREGRTSFTIAQRISTVRNADLILLLDQGRLVDQGTYEDLLNRSGVFCELIAEQFADAELVTE